MQQKQGSAEPEKIARPCSITSSGSSSLVANYDGDLDLLKMVCNRVNRQATFMHGIAGLLRV
jgi:hypothetical protein